MLFSLMDSPWIVSHAHLFLLCLVILSSGSLYVTVMYFRDFLHVKQTNQCRLIDLQQACRLDPLRAPFFLLCSYFFFMCQQQMHFFPPMWLKRTKYYWLWGLPWLSTTSSPSLCITESSTVSGRWHLQVVSINAGKPAELFKPPA